MPQSPLPLALITTTAAGTASAVIPVATNIAYKCISEMFSTWPVQNKIAFGASVAALVASYLLGTVGLSSDDPW